MSNYVYEEVISTLDYASLDGNLYIDVSHISIDLRSQIRALGALKITTADGSQGTWSINSYNSIYPGTFIDITPYYAVMLNSSSYPIYYFTDEDFIDETNVNLNENHVFRALSAGTVQADGHINESMTPGGGTVSMIVHYADKSNTAGYSGLGMGVSHPLAVGLVVCCYETSGGGGVSTNSLSTNYVNMKKPNIINLRG